MNRKEEKKQACARRWLLANGDSLLKKRKNH